MENSPDGATRPAAAEMNSRTTGLAATCEVMLPVQFFGDRSRGTSSPEKRLMLAVMEDAVFTVMKYAGRTSKHARRLVRDVERWTTQRNSTWPFSFENICAVLDLDPAALRDRLRRLQLRGERHGPGRVLPFVTQHRVVGRQHRVVLSPAQRRKLAAAG
jgi:hypothetical protein